MPDEMDDKGSTVDNVKITKKMLKGLFFTGAESEEVKIDGATKIRHTPFKRDLELDDLLDARDLGNGSVSIVTKDGRKYTVSTGK